MTDAIDVIFKDPDAELSALLGEIDFAYKIVVKREEPDWCRGTLGTFEFDEGEIISTDWISSRFGGQKYQIKILSADNRHITSRRVRFPEPPRRDGLELVKGPNGPITILEREEQKAAQAAVQAPPSQDNGIVGVLENMLAAQTAQANQMQTMLLGRVQGLETVLTTKLLESANAANATPADPQSQLKQTLDMFKMFEDFKGVVGGGASETGEIDSSMAMLGPIVEKFMTKMADTPTQKQQITQQLPSSGPTNLQLAGLVKERIKTMGPKERDLLLSHVLEDVEDETPIDTGLEEVSDIGSLLSEDDLDQLEHDEIETTKNDSEEIQAR